MAIGRMVNRQSWSTDHPYWLAVKDPADTVTYYFHPMVPEAETLSFTVDTHALPSTVDAMVEQGVELILEVDSVPDMRNPRVLFYRQNGGGDLIFERSPLVEKS